MDWADEQSPPHISVIAAAMADISTVTCGIERDTDPCNGEGRHLGEGLMAFTLARQRHQVDGS